MDRRPRGTTLAAETRRHGLLIALAARSPPPRKLQNVIERIATLWSPPEFAHCCLDGSVHWRVRPEDDAVTVVASHHTSPVTAVRGAVLIALGHLDELPSPALEAVRVTLGDPDPMVRLQAARTAATHPSEVLTRALNAALADRVWKARWYAAAALAGSAFEGRAARALAVTEPSRISSLSSAGRWFLLAEWLECARLLATHSAPLRDRIRVLAPQVPPEASLAVSWLPRRRVPIDD